MIDIIHSSWFVNYIINSLTTSLFELIWTFGLSIAIAVTMSIISRFIYKHLYQEYGSKGVSILIYATALGTVIHELSHALFCIIFKHKITNISLFNPDPDGTLGYVEHAYNIKSSYQMAGNFFIGIAPIVMTGLLTYLLTILLIPDIIPKTEQTHAAGTIVLFVVKIYHNILTVDVLSNWHFWLYVVLIFTIAGHATLSKRPDTTLTNCCSIVLAP